MLSLRLLAPDDPNFIPLLVDKIAHSPDFFRNAPLVLDVGAARRRSRRSTSRLLAEHLRQHRLMPVGIQNGTPEWNEAAMRRGPRRVRRRQPAARRRAEAPAGGRPARGSARGGGAAARAAGHGDRRAGARRPADRRRRRSGRDGPGQRRGRARRRRATSTSTAPCAAAPSPASRATRTALIFCDQLEAELLSVAGVHLVSEEIDPKHQRRRARVALEDERLVIHTLVLSPRARAAAPAGGGEFG